MPMTCAECRFQMYGECRRYAPKPWTTRPFKNGEVEVVPLWPAVEIYSDGCGEFMPPELPPAREPYTGPLPCPTCDSPNGKEHAKKGLDGDCPTCGATDEIPF